MSRRSRAGTAPFRPRIASVPPGRNVTRDATSTGNGLAGNPCLTAISEIAATTNCENQNLVIVGKIVHVAAKIICVKTQLTEKTFGRSHFEVVAVGRFDWKPKHAGVQRNNRRRTGEQNIFKRRGLKYAIVGGMHQQVGRRKIARGGKTRA